MVVSDLSGFDAERDVFAARPHDLFVEVKYVGHGGGQFAFVGKRTIKSYLQSDLERLQQNLDRKRCRAAALLLVDDNSYLDALARTGEKLAWRTSIRPLLASPAQLARLAAARKVRVALPPFCPDCGSPRLASFVWGMPTPELEAAASRDEVICGGCEPLGNGLDPTFGCLDCTFIEPNVERETLAAQLRL